MRIHLHNVPLLQLVSLYTILIFVYLYWAFWIMIASCSAGGLYHHLEGSHCLHCCRYASNMVVQMSYTKTLWLTQYTRTPWRESLALWNLHILCELSGFQNQWSWVSIFLGCDTVWLGNKFQTFQGVAVVPLPRLKTSNKNVNVFLDIWTIEDETTASSSNIRNKFPSDTASHSRRTDTSCFIPA